jgi:hypothetical protein
MIPSLWDQIESSLRLAVNGQKLDLHRDENEQRQVENLSTRKLKMFQIFSLRMHNASMSEHTFATTVLFTEAK